jgi:uncharacterized protein (TIGR03083 family)
VLDALERASDAFLATVRAVSDWERPALGEWTARELVGHTLRAFTTVETYLDSPAATDVAIDNATEYYAVALTGTGVHAAVAARGHEAGRALTDPTAQSAAIAERVLQRVREMQGHHVVATPFGAIALTEYLATRTIELAVHTLDLQRALGMPPSLPGSATSLCLDVLLPLADEAQLLLALTGRAALNVLG